jgi:hypothetical protein
VSCRGAVGSSVWESDQCDTHPQFPQAYLPFTPEISVPQRRHPVVVIS